jgi:hypothetical protein
MDFPQKAQDNVKARVDSVRSLGQTELGAGRALLNDVMALKPLQGVVTFGVATLDNLGSFVNKNIRITRDWVPM